MNADAGPPDNQAPSEPHHTSKPNNFLAINNLHYHANDISELRKLAEVNPKLAERLLEQRDLESARVASSYNFALLMSASLMAIVIIAFSLLVIYGGVLKTAAVTGAVLASALLVRVVLTGQWSETSWFGRMLGGFVRLLGGERNQPD